MKMSAAEAVSLGGVMSAIVIDRWRGEEDGEAEHGGGPAGALLSPSAGVASDQVPFRLGACDAGGER